MFRILTLLVLFFATCRFSYAQELKVSCVNEGLDVVLSSLKTDISYDNDAMADYRVTVDRSFGSVDEALEFLLKDTQYTFRKISGVYVLVKRVPKKIKVTSQRYNTVPELPVVRMYNLSEIVISSDALKYSAEKGDFSAELHLDAHYSRYIPGSGDNSVFNLLRMLPGLRASNEPSNELIVWGSRAGESRMIFDGIRLFGMQSFNDNISSVNPYMVKDIVLKKGAYGAEIGNQCGAIAEITSSNADYERFSVKMNLGTHTANVYLNVPLFGKAAVELAYRRTFYDLYQRIDTIKPQYTFSDLNVKISGKSVGDDTYRLSFYGADDSFGYRSVDTENDVTRGRSQNNQWGLSAQYNRIWNGTTRSDIQLSFTNLRSSRHFTNLVQEFTSSIAQSYTLRNHLLKAGLELEYYRTDGDELFKPTVYVSDEFTYNGFRLKSGLRMDMIMQKINLQPRISASYDFDGGFQLMFSSGLYNQYVSRVPYDSETFKWGITDSFYSIHNVGGFSYNSPFGLYTSIEGYYKRNCNSYRYDDVAGIQKTDIDLSGMDLYVKYDFSKGTVYSSYSLSVIPEEETAHEFKAGTLLTIKPFVFSANYVYGTGFRIFGVDKPYNRLDVSVTYRVKIRQLQFQAGISVMNVTNSRNLKYYETKPGENDIFSLYNHSTPLTPMAFIEVMF